MKYTKVLAVITVILIAVTGLYALIRVGYARAGETVRPQESNTLRFGHKLGQGGSPGNW
jgi:hypothetical protein